MITRQNGRVKVSSKKEGTQMFYMPSAWFNLSHDIG